MFVGGKGRKYGFEAMPSDNDKNLLYNIDFRKESEKQIYYNGLYQKSLTLVREGGNKCVSFVYYQF